MWSCQEAEELECTSNDMQFYPPNVSPAANYDDHAVALANDCPFGLGSAVWSRNAARARAVGERIEVGLCIRVTETQTS